MVVGAHIIDNKPIMYNPWGRIINDGIGIHGCRAHTIDNKLIMYNPWGRIINDELWPASSSNSGGVAIS